MNTTYPSLLAVLAVLSFASLTAEESSPALSARQVAAGVSSAMKGNSLVRAKLSSNASGSAQSYQLKIKTRRTAAATDMVYEVLWPKERKGEAVILHQDSNGEPSGTLVTADGKMTALKGAALDGPMLGSDLSYQDALENPFVWTNQVLNGSEKIDDAACLILESKPPTSQVSPYQKVRSWVDTRRYVPMRIEKYNSSGKLARRIDTKRVNRDDNRRFIPSELTVTTPGKNSTTELEGARIDQDVTFTDAEFTPQGLGK